MKTEIFEGGARATEDLLGLRFGRFGKRALCEILGSCVSTDSTDSEDGERVGDKTPVQQGCHCSIYLYSNNLPEAGFETFDKDC